MPKTVTKAATKTKTLAYDVAEQLRTPEEMAAYLDAWLTEAPDDAAGIARALGNIARTKGMSQVARDAGLSRESLYKALGENGNPSFATILKVARALGVRRLNHLASRTISASDFFLVFGVRLWKRPHFFGRGAVRLVDSGVSKLPGPILSSRASPVTAI